MNGEVIVIGAELDGQVAALRLREHGYLVRMITAGEGSLHYAPGGLRVLGYDPGPGGGPLPSPMSGLPDLGERHPYRMLGAEPLRRALAWFLDPNGPASGQFTSNGGNAQTLTPSGLELPTYGPMQHQATSEAFSGGSATIVRFIGHQDFPAALIRRELERRGVSVTSIELEAPGGRVDNIAIARWFDRLSEPEVYFRALASQMPADTGTALFPAVLGLEAHERIVAAAKSAGIDCLEIPTVPPSVPGHRLTRRLKRQLTRQHVVFHEGTTVRGRPNGTGHIGSVEDARQRAFEGTAFILSSGGVLMGGLDVEPCGTVRETVFGLDVAQTAPLDAARVDLALDALHRTGVETDEQLRPARNGTQIYDNLFVTGATLANWNPLLEASAEGVSVATGFAAAEAVHAYFGGPQ